MIKLVVGLALLILLEQEPQSYLVAKEYPR